MHQDRKYLRIAYLIEDIFLISFSFCLPYYLRYSRNFSLANLPHFRDYSLLFFFWGLSIIFFLNNYRLYTTDRSLTIPKETLRVIKSVIFGSILAALIIFILKMLFFSRLVFVWAIILLNLSLSLWRAVKRIIVRYHIIHGYYNLNVLIVGAGKSGTILAEEIKNNPYLGRKIIGFLDDSKTDKIFNYNILGKIKDLEYLTQRYFIDEIYVSIPSERERVAEILAVGKKMRKTVRILADNFSSLKNTNLSKESKESLNGLPFSFGRITLDYIGMIPSIGYIDVGLHGTDLFVKRMLDVFIAATSLILLSPLFAIITILIKLDSRGTVFYKSLRCGKKGKLFNFYKFRSMVMDAHNHKEALRDKSEVKGPIFKIKNDPRVTRLGRFLRRYSLDELPQLINVLKGDMSLVGPRPPIPDEVDKYNIWQMRRLDIRPGITCLSQIRGRSELTFREWVKWDTWYINNWSFTLDLKILWWTIPAVLRAKGAY